MERPELWGRWISSSLIALALGCGAGDASQGNVGGAASTPPPNGAMTANSGPPSVPAAGTTGGLDPASGDTASVAMPTSGAGIPCDVAHVVGDNCTLCHSRPTKFGARMPLMTHADFHASAVSDATRKVYELVSERINAQEVSRRMPPAPGELSAADLGAMNEWLAAGAPSSTGDSCEVTPVPDGSAGAAAPPPARDGTSSIPIEYDDPNLQCAEFRAHADGGTAPYAVGVANDQYVSFDFAPPWAAMGTVYARSISPLIDNDQVIHHWLLFKSTGRELMHGWAPGTTDVYYTPDLGAEFPGDTSYELEIHYNSMDASALDASGVEICYTTTVPENIVTMSWLGTDLINGTTATGTCIPRNLPAGGAHVLRGNPHMHLKGTNMRVVLNRADGTQEIVHDDPFDFNYQIAYDEDIWVMPGDTITTTCTYNAPSTFGTGTASEMCYWFAYYYPPLALTDSGLIGGAIHGNNTCLGL